MATARCFLRLEPTWRYSWPGTDDDPKLDGVKVTGATQKRPRTAQNGCVVELSITVPDAAFKPLRPRVTIDIPPEALDFEPTVNVELPEATP